MRIFVDGDPELRESLRVVLAIVIRLAEPVLSVVGVVVVGPLGDQVAEQRDRVVVVAGAEQIDGGAVLRGGLGVRGGRGGAGVLRRDAIGGRRLRRARVMARRRRRVGAGVGVGVVVIHVVAEARGLTGGG